MNKFLLGAIGTALLVALLLTGTSYTGVDIAHAAGNVNVDIDPNPLECSNTIDDDADTVVNDGCAMVGDFADCDANCNGDCLDAGEDVLCTNTADNDACDSSEDGNRKINDGCPAVDVAETDNAGDALGVVQPCYEITCPSANCTWNGVSTFDGLSDYKVDVVVSGDTLAPVAYDASVNFDATKVNIAGWSIGTTLTAACGPSAVPITCNVVSSAGFVAFASAQLGPPSAETVTIASIISGTKVRFVSLGSAHANGDPVFTKLATDPYIKLPGSLALGDTLPDSTSPYSVGAAYLAGGPGLAGDGTILRLGLDIGAAGVVTFTQNAPPQTAYKSTNPSPPPPGVAHPLTLFSGTLAINDVCPTPKADMSVDSVETAPASMNVNTDTILKVDSTGTNGGPITPALAGICHTVTAPADCTVNGGATATDCWTAVPPPGVPGNIAVGTPQLLSTNFTVNCSTPSEHVFEVENTIELQEPGVTDPDLLNNVDTDDVSIDALATADVAIHSFTAAYTRVDLLGNKVINKGVPTNITVTKVLHDNGGTYNDNLDVTLHKTATVTYPNAASEADLVTATCGGANPSCCANWTDDDWDGAVNDGCPPVGVPEDPLAGQCLNARDDKEDGLLTPDGVVNDGCPVVVTAATATGPADHNVTLVNSVDSSLPETFTVTCTELGFITVTFDNTVTIATPHVSDPTANTASASLTLRCVAPFVPSFTVFIDTDTGPPITSPQPSKACIYSPTGVPCKTLSKIDIPAGQPLGDVSTIYPAQISIKSGLTTTTGATVGQIDFGVIADIPGVTPYCMYSVAGVGTMYDGCLPNGIESGCANTNSPYALFPGSGDCTSVAQGCGFVAWANQLTAVTNTIDAKFPPLDGQPAVYARYVGQTGSPLYIPINVLVFNLGPSGWLQIGVTKNPDGDLDGKWDPLVDIDDDNDGLPDAAAPIYGPDLDDNTGPCNDGVDNNGNTLIDMADPACIAVGLEGNGTVGGTPNNTEQSQCTPYHSYSLFLGVTQGIATEKTRWCNVYAMHLPVVGNVTRLDTGESIPNYDFVDCSSPNIDLSVTLTKDEVITVPEDLVHTETVTINVHNAGPAPDTATVDLTQVSIDRTKCVSHLVANVPAGDILHEFTVGNQYYSKLTIAVPSIAASANWTTTRNYNIVCSEEGEWLLPPLGTGSIEQFVANVTPTAMTETNPVDNTDENHVGITSLGDWDGDGFDNDEDNCPYVYNPDQINTDEFLPNGDGLGDACDPDDDGDTILDVDDDCPLLPGEAGPHPNNGCPSSDVSIVVLKDDSVEVNVSESTEYDVKVTVHNGALHAANVDVDLLLVSPNPADNDPVMDEGCIVDWKDSQAGLTYVAEVIQDPALQYKLHSQLSSEVPIAFAAGESKEYNLKAYIHCYEKSNHPDAFELKGGVAPLPPVWDGDSTNNVAWNLVDVTAIAQADVDKESFAPVGAPTNITVGADVPITLRAVLHNNGPYAGPPTLLVTDEMQAGLPPTDCTVDPTSHMVVGVPLPYSVDVTVDGVFTISCDQPSTHKFTFSDLVEIDTEHVTDPDTDNNSKSATLTVNAVAEADVVIVDQGFVAPPSTMPINTNVVVTLEKVLHNNGGLPVTVTVTKVADAPADCTIDPESVSHQVPLPPSVDVVLDEEFTIRCSNPSEHTFSVSNTVSGPKEAHVTDPDLTNNIASTDLTVAALGQANIEIHGVVAVPALLKVAPLVNNAVTANTTIHNLGPLVANSAKTVTVKSPANLGENQCSINSAMVSPVTIVNAAPEVDPVSVDRVEADGFNIDLPAGTATCTFKVTSEKSLTGVHMGDPDLTNNIASAVGLVCRDRDTLLCPGPAPCPDGVADPEATAENAQCGPADNCPDHYNPLQEDADLDGVGDVCDTTPDHDVTVKSLSVLGPAPVNLSDTTGHYMWAIGEIGNLRNHKETVTLTLTITPDGVAGCIPDPFVPQQILPGRNPFFLLPLEQKWVLYRTRFECHSPAVPGITPLDIELCIQHMAHVPPSGGDVNAANDCQSRIKSLLLQ